MLVLRDAGTLFDYLRLEANAPRSPESAVALRWNTKISSLSMFVGKEGKGKGGRARRLAISDETVLISLWFDAPHWFFIHAFDERWNVGGDTLLTAR